VQRTCETVDFHGGRPWAVEVACWDLAGRAAGTPVWQLLGGDGGSLAAYASTGELAGPQERASRAVALRDRGLRALKIRFHHADWRDDVRVVEAVRDAVGDEMEIMVDANQGWRMPGDLAPPGTSPPHAPAPRRSSRSASTGWRSRCPRPTSTATRPWWHPPACRSRPGRWCARSTRRATC
jgi:hypothetical protein